MTTEQNLPKELEGEVVTLFQDCDPFGHLNNACYMDLFRKIAFSNSHNPDGFNQRVETVRAEV